MPLRQEDHPSRSSRRWPSTLGHLIQGDGEMDNWKVMLLVFGLIALNILSAYAARRRDQIKRYRRYG